MTDFTLNVSISDEVRATEVGKSVLQLLENKSDLITIVPQTNVYYPHERQLHVCLDENKSNLIATTIVERRGCHALFPSCSIAAANVEKAAGTFVKNIFKWSNCDKALQVSDSEPPPPWRSAVAVTLLNVKVFADANGKTQPINFCIKNNSNVPLKAHVLEFSENGCVVFAGSIDVDAFGGEKADHSAIDALFAEGKCVNVRHATMALKVFVTDSDQFLLEQLEQKDGFIDGSEDRPWDFAKSPASAKVEKEEHKQILWTVFTLPVNVTKPKNVVKDYFELSRLYREGCNTFAVVGQPLFDLVVGKTSAFTDEQNNTLDEIGENFDFEYAELSIIATRKTPLPTIAESSTGVEGSPVDAHFYDIASAQKNKTAISTVSGTVIFTNKVDKLLMPVKILGTEKAGKCFAGLPVTLTVPPELCHEFIVDCNAGGIQETFFIEPENRSTPLNLALIRLANGDCKIVKE